MAEINGKDAETPETEFELRDLDPYLREQVSDPVLPPSTKVPALLPFGQRSPEDFERICVAVAEQVDGLRDVRLYGVPGQKQEGLDLVGWDKDGNAVVYQARRLATFVDRDLRDAVEDYANGRRPFGAKRFVVCVASPGRRTEVIEELARLKARYGFEIDLYDQERLSALLKERGDLVRRLFGDEWERLFCDGEPAKAPTPSPADLLAEAILRGPLETLGLAETVSKAEAEVDSDPAHAAEQFNRIATVLEGGEFSGFAETYRQRQAECSIKAGDLTAAMRLHAEIGWRDVERGSAMRVRETTRKLEELAGHPEAPEAARQLAEIFKAVDRWHADPFYDLEDIARVVEQLVEHDEPGADEAALWTAESALVNENLDLVRGLAKTFELVAGKREARSEADEIAVRLRICVAEATGDWQSILDRALRGRLGRRQAALVHARYGRNRVWVAEPQAADKSYRLAIDQACQADMNAEAAAALRSIWTIGARFGLPENEWFGAVELARAVQTAGTDFLQSAYDRRAAGLGELADGKLPSALSDLRAHLRASVVSGRLAAEIDAHTLLAKLYVRASEYGLAARHNIRAGNAKEVEEILSKVTTFVDCTDELEGHAPWERATALSALAAQGDFIPDDRVDQLVRIAIERSAGEPQGMFTPWVWLSAYKLLAALSPRISDELVDPILDLLEPLIDREPNRYRHNDDQHVRIVAELFLGHPERRDRTGPHLVALMAASPELGNDVLKVGWDALEAGQQVLLEDLRRIASEGSEPALRALLHLEDDHPLLVGQARKLLDKALHPPERKPGHYAIGSDLPRTATFVRLLDEADRSRFAEQAMLVAENESEMEPNRGDAIEGVMIVARTLPDEVRDALFDRTMLLVGSAGSSKMDDHLKAGLHPLSRFRFDFGFGSLVPQAVRAAGALARNREHYDAVIEAASALFRTGNEFAANQAAHAISYLPQDEANIDVRLLAASPIRWPRQLAAALWVHRPDEVPTLGNHLAADEDRGVRRTLANGLATLRERRPDLAEELVAILSSDSSASVRREVSGES